MGIDRVSAGIEQAPGTRLDDRGVTFCVGLGRGLGVSLGTEVEKMACRVGWGMAVDWFAGWGRKCSKTQDMPTTRAMANTAKPATRNAPANREWILPEDFLAWNCWTRRERAAA